MNSTLSRILFMVWFLIAGTNRACSEVKAIDFSLFKWGSEDSADLASFKGQIVVLDFFAPWCAPCRNASSQIGSGVQDHYEARGGNCYGIPVRVVAMNIDDSRPSETAEFIKNSGLEYVLNDFDGLVLKQYGGVAIPFIVIIDATCTAKGGAPEIVHSMAGFEGVEGLRKIIDGIGGPSQVIDPASDVAAPVGIISQIAECRTADSDCSLNRAPCVMARSSQAEKETDTPFSEGTRNMTVDSAYLHTKDTILADTMVEYNLKNAQDKFTASATYGHIGMDYIPFDATQQRKELESHRIGALISGQYRLTDSLEWNFSGGTYKGFMDYRSLWLNEYYRQLFGSLPEYQKANPRGYSVTTGSRWEYLPACGFLQGTLSYQSDVISPSYEVDLSTLPPSLIRAKDEYETIGGGISLENVLTSRMRTLQELQILKTTSRELRFIIKSSLNLAVCESLVWRVEIAGSEENPSFKSRSIGSVLEHDWNKSWFLSLTTRYYEDTGQIELPLPGDSSAPAVRTYQTALGLRWQGASHAIKFSIGSYVSDYLELPAGKEFEPLYQNRGWLYTHVAYSLRF